jgi:hypothetical protein
MNKKVRKKKSKEQIKKYRKIERDGKNTLIKPK